MGGLRIALLARSTPAHLPAGGMERHTDQLARGLARRGHAVTLLTTALPPGAAADSPEPGLEIRYLPGTRPGLYRGGYLRAARAAFAALHAATPFELILSQSAGAWSLLDLPAAERPPCLAVLHGNPLGELRAAWRSQPWHPKTWVRTALWPRQHARDAARLPRCAALIAVSASVAARVAREYPAVAGRLHVVPNGIALDGRPLAAPAASERVLFVGRVIAAKGVFVLVDAFARVAARRPAARLRVLGGGELAALARRVARLGLAERVELAGPLPHAEVAAELAQAGLFVLPTQCEEGLPLSVLEAMASGLPVLSVARGGVGEALRDGEEGVLLPEAAVQPLAAALEALLADPARRAQLGAAARRRAEAAFSETAMLDAYEAQLVGLAGRAQPGAEV